MNSWLNRDTLWWWAYEVKDGEILWKIKTIADKCNAVINKFIQDGKIERRFTKEQVICKIDDYLKIHGESITERVKNGGKILIPMNSADWFASQVCEKLGIHESSIIRVKISTYNNWNSEEKSLSERTKKYILWKLGDSKNIDVIEDLCDTWNTISLLHELFSKNGITDKYICLLNKWVKEADSIKKNLGKNLDWLIDTSGFILWCWIDFQERLFADLDWIYTVKEEYINEFIDAIKRFADQIGHILGDYYQLGKMLINYE